LFPMPLGQAILLVVTWIVFPLIKFVIPLDPEYDPTCYLRIGWAVFSLAKAHLLMGVVVPVLGFLLASTDNVYCEVGFVLLIMLVKFIMEKVGEYVCPRLGADVMPIFTYSASVFYQVNLCFILCSGVSPAVFALVVGVGFAESSYHLWCMKQRVEAKPKTLRRQNSFGDPNSVGFRQQSFILSSLLIRRFLECSTVALFMVEACFLYNLSYKNNSVVCIHDNDSIWRTCIYISSFFLVQVFGATLAVVVLIRRRLQPIRFLRGLIARFWPSFLGATVCAHIVYMSEQHSHSGMDLSLRFRWLQGATWVCGLQYQPV